MPSPVPGMDPFIESQLWGDFHTAMINTMREMLVPSLRPNYMAVIEERVYLEHETDERTHIKPGITIADEGNTPLRGDSGVATAVAEATMAITLPVPEEVKEHFLTIRRPGEKDVVTVIELLSITNKRANSDGRRNYLEKRAQVLWSHTNLVEIDLLRGGLRMPADPPLQAFDYSAIVSRRRKRPRAEAMRWNLQQPLPKISIPLDESDPDVELDLQVAFASIYDRAGYDYTLDYRLEPQPPLSPEDAAWVRDIVGSLGH